MRNLRPHLFLLGANLIYGANYAVAKEAMVYLPPFAIILVRVVIGLLLFMALKPFVAPGLRPRRSDLLRLIACGLFGVAVNQLLFFKGLDLTSEIHAALIMITTPILVLGISRLLLGEAITTQKAIGILLGGSGVAWLVLQGGGDSGAASPLGDLFVLINAASYGIYLVLVKPLMQRYHPVAVIGWVFFFGSFFVIPVAGADFLSVSWSEVPRSVWLALTYVVVATTFLAYLFNILALKDASPTMVSIYIYTQPLIATLIAVSLGREQMDMAMLGAGVLVILGVSLVSFRRRLPLRA